VSQYLARHGLAAACLNDVSVSGDRRDQRIRERNRGSERRGAEIDAGLQLDTDRVLIFEQKAAGRLPILRRFHGRQQLHGSARLERWIGRHHWRTGRLEIEGDLYVGSVRSGPGGRERVSPRSGVETYINVRPRR